MVVQIDIDMVVQVDIDLIVQEGIDLFVQDDIVGSDCFDIDFVVAKN